MAASVANDITSTKQGGTLHRPGQERNRFLPDRLIQCAQINEVRCVQHDRIEAICLYCLRKRCILLAASQRGTPSSWITGKNLHGITTNLVRHLGSLDGF